MKRAEIYLTRIVDDSCNLYAIITRNGREKTIKNPSGKIILEAIKQNSLNILKIDNPSEKLQLTVIEKDPYNIKLITNPTEAAQLTAIKKDIGALNYINNPSDKIKILKKIIGL